MNNNNLMIKYQPAGTGAQIALAHIQHMRQLNPNYSVIDIGGHREGWSKQVANLIVDIQSPASETTIPLDICMPWAWDQLQALVEIRGEKFDYAICTHTLEDIYDPIITLRRLSWIAHKGIITMPSLRTELSHVENASWLGYIHHRWIFDQVDQKMLVMPKLPFLEARYHNQIQFLPECFEISYEWHKQIPFVILSDNYFPSAEAIINMYDHHIAQSLQLTAPG